MAYDLHLAKTALEAEKMYADFQIPEQVHDELFSKDRPWVRKSLMLGRMKDYYKNAKFSCSELPSLRSELERILRRERDPHIRMALKGLRLLCILGIERGVNLFCFAD
jgi:hypothetical protein